MTLVIVETPAGRDAAWSHILGVVLGDWLGLEWRRATSGRADVRITLAGAGGEVVMPTVFLSARDDLWRSASLLPTPPLAVLEPGCSEGLTEQALPVIFGTQGAVRVTGDVVRLPVDVFGSAFFMLSRYEEAVLPDRDAHDRFPSSASLAVRAGFIDQPLVDDYVDLLWMAMSRLWPGLARRVMSFRTVLSHDVDVPGKYGPGSPLRRLRTMGGEVVRRRRFAEAVRGPMMAAVSMSRLPDADPYNTFDWLMDVGSPFLDKRLLFHRGSHGAGSRWSL